MKWLRSLLFSFPLLLLCGGSSVSSPAYYTISGVDPGGVIMVYVNKYEALKAAGVSIRVDGICVSACTVLLGIFPEDRVCMTARSSFGFHEASSDDGPEVESTKAFVNYLYPKWVQEWIARTGGLSKDPRYMFPEDAKDHIKLCAGETYTGIDPQKLITPDNPGEGEKIIFKPHP